MKMSRNFESFLEIFCFVEFPVKILYNMDKVFDLIKETFCSVIIILYFQQNKEEEDFLL